MNTQHNAIIPVSMRIHGTYCAKWEIHWERLEATASLTLRISRITASPRWNQFLSHSSACSVLLLGIFPWARVLCCQRSQTEICLFNVTDWKFPEFELSLVTFWDFHKVKRQLCNVVPKTPRRVQYCREIARVMDDWGVILLHHTGIQHVANNHRWDEGEFINTTTPESHFSKETHWR